MDTPRSDRYNTRGAYPFRLTSRHIRLSPSSWEPTLPVDSSDPTSAILARTIPVPQASLVLSPDPSPNVPSPAPSLAIDIYAIVQAVFQTTLAANAASVAANPPAHTPAPTLSQPASCHQPPPSNKFFLKVWDGNCDSFLIFQARICAWFAIPSFEVFTTFT